MELVGIAFWLVLVLAVYGFVKTRPRRPQSAESTGWVTPRAAPWYLKVVGVVTVIAAVGVILLTGITVFYLLIIGW